MGNRERTAQFLESLRAGWTCRSWFCRERGPFTVKDFGVVQKLAAEHSRETFLGLFHHHAFAYELNADQIAAGARLANLLRTGYLDKK